MGLRALGLRCDRACGFLSSLWFGAKQELSCGKCIVKCAMLCNMLQKLDGGGPSEL